MTRYIVAILGLVLLIGSLIGVKATQIAGLIKAGEAFAKAGPPPESVGTEVSRVLDWEGTLSAVGSVAAAQGVSVSNDAPGVVKKILFESGDLVKPGQVLVELDSSVERAQLATAQARQQLAQTTFNRTSGLAQAGTVSQSVLDADNSGLKAASAEVDGLRAQIDRKIVRAPFAGRLGIRAINLGQYLSPGTTITTLEALDTVFVDFTLPQQALPSLRTGLGVRVGIEGIEQFTAEGQIVAIDPALDRATRSLRVRASVPNPDQKLRPGMFARVAVLLPGRAQVVAIPMTAVVHAPYGDSVFIVEPLSTPDAQTAQGEGANAKASAFPVRQVRQQFVRLGEERGDFVAVLEGVSAGQEVVTAGAFKLRNGAKVAINNRTKVEPQLAPRPDNH